MEIGVAHAPMALVSLDLISDCFDHTAVYKYTVESRASTHPQVSAQVPPFKCSSFHTNVYAMCNIYPGYAPCRPKSSLHVRE